MIDIISGNSTLETVELLKMLLMIVVGGVLIWLAISKKYEPALLLPIGFGTIIANIPFSAAVGPDGPITFCLWLGYRRSCFPFLSLSPLGL